MNDFVPVEPMNVDCLPPGSIIRDPFVPHAFAIVLTVRPQYKSVHLSWSAADGSEHHLDLPYTAFMMTYREE